MLALVALNGASHTCTEGQSVLRAVYSLISAGCSPTDDYDEVAGEIKPHRPWYRDFTRPNRRTTQITIRTA
jgi:hypothetical protein